jgi:hypothetical protein
MLNRTLKIALSAVSGAAIGAAVLTVSLRRITCCSTGYLPNPAMARQFSYLLLRFRFGAILGASFGLGERVAQMGSPRAAGTILTLTGIVVSAAILAWILPEHPERIWSAWALTPAVAAAATAIYGIRIMLRAPSSNKR